MAYSIGEHRCTIPGPAGDIEAILNICEQAKGIAVCCHPHSLHGGSMTNKVVHTLHRSFKDRQINTVRFNFRGVGKSQGSYADGIGESEDLNCVLSWITNQWSVLDLYLSGFSFGAFVSLNVASQWPLKCLVSVAPPVERFYFHDITIPNCSWLIIQPMADEVVNPEAVVNWFDNLSSDHSIDFSRMLVKLVDSSHFFHGKLVKLRQTIDESLYRLGVWS